MFIVLYSCTLIMEVSFCVGVLNLIQVVVSWYSVQFLDDALRGVYCL